MARSILVRLIAMSLATTLSLAGVAEAAPKPPRAGTVKFTWVSYGCQDTDKGLRAWGTARSEIVWIDEDSKPRSTYYQKIKIQIDTQMSDSWWRQVYGADKTFEGSRFTKAGLPWYQTAGYRAKIRANATFSAKATIWLKRSRRGLDKNVWRYAVRSPSFTCAQSIPRTPTGDS